MTYKGRGGNLAYVDSKVTPWALEAIEDIWEDLF